MNPVAQSFTNFGKKKKRNWPCQDSVIRTLDYMDLISLTVSEKSSENHRYCYSLGIVVVVVMQKLWHFVISLITEDIYLKLGVLIRYPKSNPYHQGRQFQMHICFRIFRYKILFRLMTFYTTAERWHPYALFLFILLTRLADSFTLSGDDTVSIISTRK